MKIDGLGDERRAAISQICQLVAGVQDFQIDQFNRMAASYEKEDVMMYQILSQAVSHADSNYSHFLNAKVLGTPSRYWILDKVRENEEGSVLSKVMSELRERMRDEKEYRRDFLSPEIKQVSQVYDEKLRKVQKQEIKRQKEELKTRARVERRSHSFGIGF